MEDERSLHACGLISNYIIQLYGSLGPFLAGIEKKEKRHDFYLGTF